MNTINGVRTVQEIVDFITLQYTTFIESGAWGEDDGWQLVQRFSDERNMPMSFQKEKFIEYLIGKGDRNANTYCAYLSKLEREYSVNIEAEYDQDRFVSLSDTLKAKYDEYRHTDKKMYEVLKQIRQALRKYNEFRDGGNLANTEDLSVGEADAVAGTDIGLNTILYGPPGTGKTYHTVIYAVAIIENKELAKVEAEDYSDVLKRYNDYKAQGRIEFTTFHQSYGYEEFIEGIKPVVLSADETDGVGSNIQYDVLPGVFKRFCERAERPGSAQDLNLGINESPTIWKVSLEGTGDNPTRSECMKNSHIRIGYDEYGKDITDETDFSQHGGKNVLNAFINKMQVGDIVLSCYTASTIDAIGIITGDYEWHSEYSNYKRLRKVNWIVKGIKENIVAINNGANMTLSSAYKMNVSLSDVYRLIEKYYSTQTIVPVRRENYVFIIDEINRGNISKIFGELITLIETSKRLGRPEGATAMLPYSQKPFGVPENVYILGTMNTADRSIATIDTALRRRFFFKEMLPDTEVLNEVNVEGISISEMMNRMNKRIAVLYDREHTIGHAYFMRLKDSPTIDTLGEIFANNIIPLLQEYFYEDYKMIRLVLGDNRKINESEQFIISKANNYAELFGDAELDMDEGASYEINKKAFNNIEAYRAI